MGRRHSARQKVKSWVIVLVSNEQNGGRQRRRQKVRLFVIFPLFLQETISREIIFTHVLTKKSIFCQPDV